MEDMLWNFFLEHGWKLTLIALSGIPFLGILKRAHLFDKIQNDTKRKAIFEGISSAFAILMSMIYLFAVDKFNFAKFAILSGGILMLNQTAYAIYENYGLRGLVNKGIDFVGDLTKSLITKKAEQNTTENNDENIDIIDDLPKDSK